MSLPKYEKFEQEFVTLSFFTCRFSRSFIPGALTCPDCLRFIIEGRVLRKMNMQCLLTRIVWLLSRLEHGEEDARILQQDRDVPEGGECAEAAGPWRSGLRGEVATAR